MLRKKCIGAIIPLWSNQNKIVRSMANGSAVNICPTLKSQKLTAQPRSAVGSNALLVGSTAKCTSAMRPICTKPVKKMRVSGVP